MRTKEEPDQPCEEQATTGSSTSVAYMNKDKKPTPKPKPIKVENLADYIGKHKANCSEGFKAEFEVRDDFIIIIMLYSLYEIYFGKKVTFCPDEYSLIQTLYAYYDIIFSLNLFFIS